MLAAAAAPGTTATASPELLDVTMTAESYPTGLARVRDLLDEGFRADFHDQDLGFGEWTEIRGGREFAIQFQRWLEEWSDYRFRGTNWEDVGPHALADVLVTARGRSSGVPVEIETTQLWRIEEGRVVRWSVFRERDAALAELRAREEER